MNEKPLDQFILGYFILKTLTNKYAEIAGASSGFISAMMETYGLSKKEAEEYVMQIDKIARDRVDEGYRQFLKDKEGESK